MRIKPGALARSGIYLGRAARRHVLLLSSGPEVESILRTDARLRGCFA
ncbi:hypothetical protein WME89_30525 [Sorangium sp. So ce321]